MDVETKRLGQEPLEVFVFKFAINSLLRASELTSLEAYDSNKAGDDYFNYIKIESGRAVVLVKGKNSRLREFKLGKDVTEYLLKHRFVPGERIFINHRGKPLTRNGCQYLFGRIKEKYMKDMPIYKFSPHSARHTGFTELLKRGEIDAIHLALLGGSSRSVIEKFYIHEAPDAFQDFSII